MSEAPEVHERVQAILDEVNANYAQVEQVIVKDDGNAPG